MISAHMCCSLPPLPPYPNKRSQKSNNKGSAFQHCAPTTLKTRYLLHTSNNPVSRSVPLLSLHARSFSWLFQLQPNTCISPRTSDSLSTSHLSPAHTQSYRIRWLSLRTSATGQPSLGFLRTKLKFRTELQIIASLKPKQRFKTTYTLPCFQSYAWHLQPLQGTSLFKLQLYMWLG